MVHSDNFWTVFWSPGRHIVPSGPLCNDVLEVGTAEKNWKQARAIDGAFWGYVKRCSWSLSCWENLKSNDTKWFIHVLKVGTAEKIWKQARAIDGAFWGYVKRCFGSWNCWEHFESMDDRRCILTLFKTMFLNFELLRKC